MKVSLLAVALLAGDLVAEELAIPAPLPPSRYDAMFEKSPFKLATAAPPPITPQKGFAENWYVSSLYRVFNKDAVTIKSRDLSTQFELFGNEPNEANGGVVLAGVDWSPVIGKSTVTIKKGTEFAKLEFDQQAVQNPIQGMPQQPSPQMPGMLNRTNQPPGMRALLPPRPNNSPVTGAQPVSGSQPVTGGLPVTGAQPVTNAQSVPLPSGNMPVVAPSGTETRRRVRTVPKP